MASIWDRRNLERCHLCRVYQTALAWTDHIMSVSVSLSKKGGSLPCLSQGARERKDSTKSDLSSQHFLACWWEEAVQVGRAASVSAPGPKRTVLLPSGWLPVPDSPGQ